MTRGLRLQVGRPSSKEAYLHLAGRVGRHSARGVIPGTGVSVVTAGGARELQGWIEGLAGPEGGGLAPLDVGAVEDRYEED